MATVLKAQLKALREEVGEIDDRFPQIQQVIEEHWDDSQIIRT